MPDCLKIIMVVVVIIVSEIVDIVKNQRNSISQIKSAFYLIVKWSQLG